MFFVVEGLAIYHGTGTLSSYVWSWFSVKGKGKAWRWRRLFLLAFMVWLVVHFVTGGWV
jgi:hypothetical protein